ncbi:Translation initiation factor IF-2 [Talaromyces islandicus]|uniref:Synaptobrevin homolog YKT6 n=1 Tax=Talaromyces islandicus TaxID=28573 RepID=A0A0U1LT54_TALIS|nr:Translation initiation factor IF-2 [Talaromyces islandicus]
MASSSRPSSSLLYSCIAHGTTILAEHSSPGASSTSASSLASIILPKITHDKPQKLTYTHDRLFVHYIADSPSGRTHDDGKSSNQQEISSYSSLSYLVVATAEQGRRIPFAFLLEMKRKFLSAYPPSTTEFSALPAYGCAAYNAELRALLQQYNTAPPSDSLASARREIDSVRDIMTENIERVLERGERIDLLVDKTDRLGGSAHDFRMRSRGLRRRMWWKNVKVMVLLVVVIVFLVYLFVAGTSMSSYSNFYNSYQYGNNNGNKREYTEAAYDWNNNQGAPSTTGFNGQQLNNSRADTNSNGIYSSSQDYSSHSGDLSNPLNTYTQVAQRQGDKLQSSGLNSLAYASASESAVRSTPDQAGYNWSKQDSRGSYQAPSRTVSQSYPLQPSNRTLATGGRTRSYDSQSQIPGFVSQSNTASHGHPAQQPPSNVPRQQPANNNGSEMPQQQQQNPPSRAKDPAQPQQWSNSQRVPPVPHAMTNTPSIETHTRTSFPPNTPAQDKEPSQIPNSQTAPSLMTYRHPDGLENRAATPPTNSGAETASSHHISPLNVQFVNPSQLYNQQYVIAQERARAAEAEAAAARQRQEAEAKAQAEAAAAGNGSTPTKKKLAKRIAPKKKANGKAPAPEAVAQDGGDDMAADMQRMLEKLKGMRAKDPSLFSKLWDDIKKAPPGSQQAPAQGQQDTNSNPSAAGTTTETMSMTANETPKTASKEKSTPQSHLIDGLLDLGRFPAQRRRRKGKNGGSEAALATEINVNSMLNQTPDSLSAIGRLVSITDPAPAPPPAQTASQSTPPVTQDATWPASTQQRLASAASEYLLKDPLNSEKQCSAEALMLLLRNNPSYPDLCLQLESRGFIIDRQSLARYLLAAVPALASGNNASQEPTKGESNGQAPAPDPIPTHPTQQAPQPAPLPGAAVPTKAKPRPEKILQKIPQTSGTSPPEHPPQPPSTELLALDAGSGPTSSMSVENTVPTTSAPPKNTASPSRRKVAAQSILAPPVLGPKAEKAKKRLFSEIVDLSQLSSDEEDVDELSDDGTFPRLSKLPRLEGPFIDRQLDQQVDWDSMDIDMASPQRSGAPIVGDSHVSEPDLGDFDPDDEQCLRSIKSFPRISKLLEPSAALQRMYYNPKSVARDILIAAGRHPSERQLNYHLAKFPEVFAGVSSKSDLETFRWDLVDPGGPSMPMVEAEDILAEPPRVPRKRRRDKKSRVDTGDDKSGPTPNSPKFNNSDHSSFSLSTPHNPRTSMAGAPTSGRGSGRRGRPPGAKNKNPTKAALKRATAGAARNAAAAPVHQAVPEPSYPVFSCEWAACPAQLHDVHTLERHVDKIHVVGQTSCRWSGCPNANTQYVGEGLEEHVHQAHIQPLAWKYGDGAAVNGTVKELDSYLNANGSIVTPDARTAGEGDSLIYPVESKSSIKAFYKVHGTEKPEEQAHEVLLAVRRRQQRVGVGLEQEGCEFSNPRRNKAMVNDEEYYQVVSEEEEDEDHWFQ